MKHLMMLICLGAIAGCNAPTPEQPKMQRVGLESTYPWYIEHFSIPLSFSGDLAQCGGSLHTIGATCLCGTTPTPAFLYTNSFVPTYGCGDCPGGSGYPTIYLT